MHFYLWNQLKFITWGAMWNFFILQILISRPIFDERLNLVTRRIFSAHSERPATRMFWTWHLAVAGTSCSVVGLRLILFWRPHISCLFVKPSCPAALPQIYGRNATTRQSPCLQLLTMSIWQYEVAVTLQLRSGSWPMWLPDCQLGFDSHPKALSQCDRYENQTQYTV
jgi:hypothetical protein